MGSMPNQSRVADPSANTLSDNAKAYAAAACRMLDGDQLDPALAPAFYLLISFSLELLLKAVCMFGGVTHHQVKKKIGHDLHMAYTEAMQIGKVPRVMTPLGRLVLLLQEQHKTHVFRYMPDIPSLEVPDPIYCIDTLNEAVSVYLP